MRFAQTIIAGAALVGVTLGAAVQADHKLQTRDGTPFADLDLPTSFWNAYDNYCKNGLPSKKRGLEVRASPPQDYTNVPVGTYQGSLEAVTKGGWWTNRLITCHGVVITGDASGPAKKSKWLAHFPASQATMDGQLNDLFKDIDKENLSNKLPYLSLPAIPENPPNGLTKEYMDKVEKAMIKALTDYCGGKVPAIRYHDMGAADRNEGDAGTMQVSNADKSVKIDGQDVPAP